MTHIFNEQAQDEGFGNGRAPDPIIVKASHEGTNRMTADEGARDAPGPLVLKSVGPRLLGSVGPRVQ